MSAEDERATQPSEDLAPREGMDAPWGGMSCPACRGLRRIPHLRVEAAVLTGLDMITGDAISPAAGHIPSGSSWRPGL